MNVMLRRIVEIAGGLVVGALVGEGVNKVIKVSKKVVKNNKKKREGLK